MKKVTKKVLSLFLCLAVMLSFAFPAYAETGKADATDPRQTDSEAAQLKEIGKASWYEQEPNDSLYAADKIYVDGAGVGGEISERNDVDYYKFTMPGAGFVSLSFTHDYVNNDDLTWRVQLLDKSGATIYTHDVKGNQTYTISKHVGLAAGETYCLSVESGDHTGGYMDWSSTPYLLRVNYGKVKLYETEFNDSMSSADPAKVNTETYYHGAEKTGGDEDYFKFSISKPGFISMTILHDYIDSSDEMYYFALLKSDGTPIYSTSSTGRTTEMRSCRVGLPAGTYYIKVNFGWRSPSKDYKFRINYAQSSMAETEFNDSMATANPIKTNQSINGNIMDSGDVDYYAFNMPSDGYISLSLNHAYINSDNTYWKVQLYRKSNGKLLHTAYYAGNETQGRSCRIGLPAGDYYACVLRNDSYGFRKENETNYNFRVNYVKDSSYENEANDNPETANPITKGSVKRGTLMTNRDVDYYFFSLGAKCYVDFRLTHANLSNSNSYFVVSVLNASGTPVLKYTVNGTTTTATKGTVLPAGKYTVKVEPYNWSSTPYGLLVSPAR